MPQRPSDRALSCAIAVVSLLVLVASERVTGVFRFPAARWAPKVAIVVVLGLLVWELLDRGLASRAAGAPRRWEGALLAVVSAAVLFAFIDRGRLGDWGRVLWDLRYPIVMLKAEPLGEPVLFPALGLEALFDVSLETAVRWVVVALCVPGVLFIKALADHAAPERRHLFAAAIASSGAIALFFGHIETYPFPAALMTGFLAATLASLRGERTLRGATALLGVICLLHLEFFCLVPALAFAMWQRRREEPVLRDAVLFVVLPTIAGQLVCALFESPYPQFFGGGDETMLVAPAMLLSRQHLHAVINEHLLLSPVAWIVVPLVVAARPAIARDAGVRFLGVAAASWIGFSFLWDQDLGALVDWDLFGAMGFVLSALTALVVHRGLSGRSGDRALAMIVAVQLARTIPFVAWNHRP